MTEFIDFLRNRVGEASQQRYAEIIDLLIDLYGAEMERIYDLTLVEADNVDEETALHALNTMLISTCNNFLNQQGIYIDEDEVKEESIYSLFTLVEGAVLLDGWELYDDLLTILLDDEQDNEDKFLSLVSEVIDIDIVTQASLLSDVEDIYFETLQEELVYAKTMYEASYPLDRDELQVYVITDYAKAVLRKMKHSSLINEYLKRKQTFPIGLNSELISDLTGLPEKELALSVAIVTLMQYPDIRDASTLLSKTMDNVTLLGIRFSEAVSVSAQARKLYIELERAYG